MFRSKRSSLVKRLWKSRILYNETHSETEEELEFKSVAHSMLKRLKEKQLDVLVQSVESKGGETTECVLVPRVDIKLPSRRAVSPHTLCCKLWRWPELQQGVEMKRLPCCTTANEQGYICCNPYHWSLLLKTEHSSPTQSPNQNTIERVATKDGFSPVPDETETGLTPLPRQDYYNDDSGPGGGNHWCTIAYWELRQRIGRLFPVVEPSFCVFQHLPHGDGMCLQILQQESSLETVRRTREKIGFGIILSREGDSVWAYNRGRYPAFVNSPTLDEPRGCGGCGSSGRTLLVVRKLLPGHSLRIFSYSEAASLREAPRPPELLDGPFDPCSVRISFAKGWGPCYSRQFITSCPCWVEILLSVNR